MDKLTLVERLEQIAVRHGGTLTPSAVVDDARPADSPLHKYFEWDDFFAAESFRIEQARKLIRLRVVAYNERTGQETSVPLYIRHPDAGAKEQGYVRSVTVASDSDLSHRALVAEIRRAEAVLDRVRNLAIAFDSEAEMDTIMDKFRAFAATAESWRG